MKGPVSVYWKISRCLQYIPSSSALLAKQFEERQGDFRTR